MIERILYALFGAFLGTLMAVSVQWGIADQINWLFVGLGGVLCAVLAFAWGEPFTAWLKKVWWWT